MLQWLHDADCQWVVDFIGNAAAGAPLDILDHGDFYAEPSKTPPGPNVIAHPLVNFTTMWKLICAHIADQNVPHLAQYGVLPYQGGGGFPDPPPRSRPPQSFRSRLSPI